MPEPKSNELLDHYVAGQSDAATAIFDRYIERLLALARARISSKLKRRIDPEDVVQSAYRSFFVHASNHEYQLTRSGDLWRLLASTTLNKLYGQIETHTAAKRTIHRDATEGVGLTGLTTRDPTVVEVVAIAEQLSLIMDGLSTDERLVLVSTLQGQSIEVIAKAIGRSDRTVRRLFAQARRQFEERLLGEGGRTKATRAIRRSRLSEPLAPLRFSDYILEQLLGAGGMGKVYRATDKRSGKTVAVKALHKSRQCDQRAVAQFVQESQILARLRHPNIVGVEGLGRFPAGGYFIVMDFVAGTDLQSRLAAGPIPLAEAVSIVKHVASAVQYAHEHGIVHCDLKPGNVLTDCNGHVFVTDFGFAFIFADMPGKHASHIGGTEGFIPPEILKLASKPTPASDIYAMGALLWILATGRLPEQQAAFRAETPAVEPLASVCRRCLARNPAERFPTAAALVEALEKLPAI